MDTIFNKFQATAFGLLLGTCASLPVVAEDIEIYTDVSLGAETIKPNVMFILDSSASMLVTNTPDAAYDPTVTYTGDNANSCTFNNGKIYYSFDGTIPGCGSSDYFDDGALTCDNAVKQYKLNPTTGLLELLKDADGNQVPGSLLTHGTYSDRFAQFTGSNLYKWRIVKTNSNTSRNLKIECKQDSGLHGSSDGVFYIADKPVSQTGWDSEPMTGDPANSHGIWSENDTIGTIYHGNYLNYLNEPAPAAATAPVSLFDQVKDVIIQSTIGQTGINIGLMQYDTSADAIAGSVQYPITDVTASRGDFEPRVRTMNAGGSSTISETYYEALKYFGGRDVNPASKAGNLGSSMEPGNNQYTTPITSTCQKNYIIALSDGIPEKDYVGVSMQSQENLPGFVTGSCHAVAESELNSDWNKTPGDTTATDDNCLDELSEWAANNDVAYQAGNTAHEGMQNITTFTVGFNIPTGLAVDDPLQKAEKLLQETATKGDGKYYKASDSAELAALIAEIFSGILEVNSTFSSPAVSVNAFNRATNLDDLFFTLFKPTQLATGVAAARWEGNLKKFKLEFDNGLPFVADATHNPAIDSNTGFFVDTSQSYWTPLADAPDGAETAKGGAASMMAFPRNLYTYTGNYQGNNGVLTTGNSDLTVATNKFNRGNTSISDAMLDIVDYPPLIGNDSYKYSLLSWAIGKDVFDDDGDGSDTDDRREMGDPLHAEPALIQYGLLADNATADVVAYVATNDGYLHAFDGNTGEENFAFVPQELLPKLQYIFNDTGANGKAYGLDGNVVAWINDANNDGDLLDTGEHVYLYFGMRRGGNYIYSIDVTDRHKPLLRWIIEGGVGQYAELGQTWSAPNVEKVKTGSGVDDYKVVLIFGAGYDTAQDVSTSTRDSTTGDSVGRGVFIADAETGEVLWSAGPAGASLQLTDMKYSIPARIKPLDVDGDGFVDQFYAGDLGGQLWRFDIDNASNTASSLAITGGRIADLAIDGSLAGNRRFYNPPDVALILEQGQAPYLSIVAASGYRAHPLQTDTHDRVYMIRDYDVYNAPTTYTTVTEGDLFDTTDNIIGDGTQLEVDAAKISLGTSKGWYITLKEQNGSFVGEKALSEPLLFGGVAVFTTYIPASAGLTSNSCTANDGTGRIYFVNINDGTPTGDTNGDGQETEEDRSAFLARGGIPPTPRIIITEDGIPTLCVGTECSKAGEVGTVQNMYWYEVEE